MKTKYNQWHSRRTTVLVRIRREPYDFLKKYAKKRGVTLSKLLDRVYTYAIPWLEEEDRLYGAYPGVFTDADLRVNIVYKELELIQQKLKRPYRKNGCVTMPCVDGKTYKFDSINMEVTSEDTKIC